MEIKKYFSHITSLLAKRHLPNLEPDHSLLISIIYLANSLDWIKFYY